MNTGRSATEPTPQIAHRVVGHPNREALRCQSQGRRDETAMTVVQPVEGATHDDVAVLSILCHIYVMIGY